MNAATPLLEIDHLVVEIQSMPALRGFSMRVARKAPWSALSGAMAPARPR